MDSQTSLNLPAVTRSTDQELSILTEIGQLLSSTLELRAAFGQVMQIISDKLSMRRGTLILLDESSGRLRTEAAIGLTFEEMERGKYAIGEGITGNVVANGRARIIPDVRSEPDFLNRTGRVAPHNTEAISFICVPIKIEGRTAGALSVDKSFTGDEQLRNDAKFLDIIAAFVGQAIQINRMVMRQKEELLEENAQLRAQVRDRYKFENIIGDSPAMHDVFAVVGQVANSRATVLILGENGTGKEMIAKAIHYNSPRKEKAFIRVNCGALAGTLFESELFGHVKGSFTGAIRDKIGRFEAADGGTIFLDEIGTLEPTLQVKLLRVLQEREFERVGDTQTVKVDVRVIAATNIDLQEEVARGTFREDLFYRLNVIPFFVPPLRDRKEDIPLLVKEFLHEFGQQYGRPHVEMHPDALDTLRQYNWPGNVRELRNLVERVLILNPKTQRIERKHLPALTNRDGARATTRTEEFASLTEAREAYERDYILKKLDECHGNVSRTAEALGLERSNLYRKMRALGVTVKE
jgi:Nif-specific regulatory protein